MRPIPEKERCHEARVLAAHRARRRRSLRRARREADRGEGGPHRRPHGPDALLRQGAQPEDARRRMHAHLQSDAEIVRAASGWLAELGPLRGAGRPRVRRDRRARPLGPGRRPDVQPRRRQSRGQSGGRPRIRAPGQARRASASARTSVAGNWHLSGGIAYDAGASVAVDDGAGFHATKVTVLGCETVDV